MTWPPQNLVHQIYRVVSAAPHRDTEVAGEFSPMALQSCPEVTPSSFHAAVLLKSVSFLGVLFLGQIV